MKLPAYPCYKPSGVEWLGEIAHHWNVSPIKRLVSTPITDGPHETPEIFDEGVPFVSAEAVSGGRIDFGKIRGHITAEDNKRFSKKYKPRRGDIYLIKSGATTGRVAMVETDIEFNIWSPLAAIRCNTHLADRHFLFFYMQSKEFQTAVELSWSYGTQQNIGMGVIQNLSVPVPPPAEQRAIAAFLGRETGRVDRLVSKKRELIERLKEKRTALISRAVTRGLPPAAARATGVPENPPLKPSGIDWLGVVPKHWRVKRLKFELCKIEQGWSPQCDSSPAGEGEWGVLKAGAVNGTEFDPNENKRLPDQESPLREFEIKTGDFLISRANTRELLGSAALVRKIQPHLLLCDKLYRLTIQNRTLNSEFLLRFMRSIPGRYEFERDASSASMQNIGQQSVRNLWIPVPPLSEQVAITTYLDKQTAKLDALMSKVESAIERLQEYRTALITAAVTGKIDVRGTTMDEAASKPRESATVQT